MDMKKIAVYLYVVLFFVIAGCALRQEQVSELKKFPLDSLDGVITKSGVELDKEVSSDGNGSLRISTEEPAVVRLFEVDDLDIENARLIYRARIRTEDVNGQVYLEMLCHFPGNRRSVLPQSPESFIGHNGLGNRGNPIFPEKRGKTGQC